MSKKYDTRYLGEEPILTGIFTDNADSRIGLAMSWYNYFYTVNEARQWIEQFMREKQYNAKEIIAFAKTSDNDLTMSMCSIARLINNGALLPQEMIQRFKNKITEAIASVISIPQKEINAPSIQDRIKEKSNMLIGMVEEEMDKFFINYTSDFSLYDFLRANNPSSKAIMFKYVPLLHEIDMVIAKEDKDLQEGYSNLSKKQLQAFHSFVEMLVSDAQRYFENKVTQRKPHKPKKKKEITAVQLTKKVNYMKDFSELKLVSVLPSNIVGSASCWVYNTKRKVLTNYISTHEKGLSFKGASIINIDETLSKSKALRKPSETISNVLTSGRAMLNKLMNELTTKEKPMATRLNEEIIILRCLR